MMLDPKFKAWLEENVKLNLSSKSWKEAAAYLDGKDSHLATICRRIARDMQAFMDRTRAHLELDKIAGEESKQEEADDLSQQTINKIASDK